MSFSLVAYFGFKLIGKRVGSLCGRILSGIAAETVMILGYFVFEGFLYGFAPPLVNIPANGVQGVAGIIVGMLLAKVFEKGKISFE